MKTALGLFLLGSLVLISTYAYRHGRDLTARFDLQVDKVLENY